jgi:hypothetical protein
MMTRAINKDLPLGANLFHGDAMRQEAFMH